MTIRRVITDARGLRIVQRDVRVVVDSASVQTQRAIVEDFYVLGVPATPVGTLGRPKPGGRAGDPGHGTTQHPGFLRSTLWTHAGSRAVYRRRAPTVFNPLPSIADALSNLRRAKPGGSVFITYSAPYSASIEAGIRMIRGQRYGSPQAPEGWVGPTLEKIHTAHSSGERIRRLITRNVRIGSAA